MLSKLPKWPSCREGFYTLHDARLLALGGENTVSNNGLSEDNLLRRLTFKRHRLFRHNAENLLEIGRSLVRGGSAHCLQLSKQRLVGMGQYGFPTFEIDNEHWRLFDVVAQVPCQAPGLDINQGHQACFYC